MMVTRLQISPPHLILVFVVAFVNNVALTTPQRAEKGPPNLRAVPTTGFSCQGRVAGYYADPEAECQAYHMCDTLERQYSYLCPSYTLFNQKFMVCDHWHAVNCSIASQYYDLNKKIGQVPEKKSVSEETNAIQGGSKASIPNKLSSIFKFNQIRSLVTAAKPRPLTTTRPTTKRRTITTQAPITKSFKTRTTQRNNFFTTPKPKTRFFTTKKTTPRVFTTRNPTTRFFSTRKPTTRFFTTSKPTTRRILPPKTSRPFNLTTHPPPTARPIQFTTAKTRTPPAKTTSHQFPPINQHPVFISNLHKDQMNHQSINARGSGLKIKFGKNNNESLEEINGIKLRPLFKKSQRTFFDKENFTISPEVLATTPLSTNVQNDEKKSRERKLPIGTIIPFLIPPLIESPTLTPNNSNFNFLSPFLLPPRKTPVILHGENQEILTPLVLSRIHPLFSRRIGFPRPNSVITPPRFPFSKPNPDFFIPAPGLLPPLPDNSISDKETHHDDMEDVAHHQMTMTFPNSSTIRRRRPLRINPDCPRCHPAFLRPNECQPCVIIK